MLLKLIKHEFKAVSPIFLQMIIGLLAVTAVTMSSVVIYKADASLNDTWQNALNGLTGFMIFIFAVAMIAVSTLCFIVLIRRFYSTMVGKKAYLSYTMPVTAGQLVGSKLIVATVWTIIVGIVSYASIMAVVVSFIAKIFRGSNLIERAQMETARAFSMSPELANAIRNIAVLLPIATIISIIYSIIIWYFAAAVGMQFNKHKVLMMILTVVGISFAFQMIGNAVLLMDKNLWGLYMEADRYDNMLDGIAAIVRVQERFFVRLNILMLVCSILAFLGTNYLVSKRPNIIA